MTNCFTRTWLWKAWRPSCLLSARKEYDWFKPILSRLNSWVDFSWTTMSLHNRLRSYAIIQPVSFYRQALPYDVKYETDVINKNNGISRFEYFNCYREFGCWIQVEWNMQDPRALKKRVMEIYAKYVGNQVKVTDINVPLKDESFHQRDILERKVFCLLQQKLRLGNQLWYYQVFNISGMFMCQTSRRKSSLQTAVFYFFTMDGRIGNSFCFWREHGRGRWKDWNMH